MGNQATRRCFSFEADDLGRIGLADATDLKSRFSRFLCFAPLISLAQFAWVNLPKLRLLLFVRARAEMGSFSHKFLHNFLEAAVFTGAGQTDYRTRRNKPVTAATPSGTKIQPAIFNKLP
jgi:hypothetical protein